MKKLLIILSALFIFQASAFYDHEDETLDLLQEQLRAIFRHGNGIISMLEKFQNELKENLKINGTEKIDFSNAGPANLIDSVDPKYMVLYMYIKGAMKATLQLDNVSIPPELEDDFYLRLMSQLAPVLGSRLPPGINPVSPECSAASWTYLANLFLFGGGAASEIDQVPWALKMFDSMGKIPDGIFADTMELCEVLDQYGQFFGGINCDLITATLDFPLNLRGLINIPLGNTFALGSFEGCIDIKSMALFNQTTNPLGLREEFKGAWIPVKINGNITGLEPETKKPTPRLGSGFSVIGGLGNAIIPELPTTADSLVRYLMYLYLQVGDFRIGYCVPNTCHEADIYINNYLSFNPVFQADIMNRIQTEDNQHHELDSFAISIIVIFSIIGFFMLLGTLAEIWEDLNPFPILALSKKDQAPNPVVQTLKCFSIISNSKTILNTDTPKSHLNSLAGLRTISMGWIIYGHLYMYGQFLSGAGLLENRLLPSQIASGEAGWGYEIILNAFPSVDTFFFMSGLLVAYLSFGELDRKRFNLTLFYVHRYLRLGIPLGLTIAFTAAFFPFLAVGPNVYEGAVQQADLCKETGWRTMLYINNFWTQDEQCIPQTWYLANDMQFYILSPLLILPLYKNRTLGFTVCGVVYGVLTFLMGYLVIHYELPPSHTFPTPPKESFDMTTYFYDVPWTRFQPYLIGILFGYLLFVTKKKEIKISHTLNLLLWQASLITMFTVVFGIAKLRENDTGMEHTWTAWHSVFYNCFHKTAWSLALGWVVFSCHKGYGGIINDFLSWKAFIPLSKLTYGAYLLHIQIQFLIMFGLTSPIYLSDFLLSQYFIGFFGFTFATSFVFSITLELPFANLEKLILSGNVKKQVPPKPVVTGKSIEVKTNGEVPKTNGQVPMKEEMKKVDEIVTVSSQVETKI